jgi:2-oxoisovalerate dehydrogenase E1 component beta subunit
VLGVTKGLYPKFPDRVLDTPISESAIMGAAAGAASSGLRPVAELMFVDFMGVCLDQIFNQAAKFRYMFGGKAVTPMVVRTMYGAGIRAASQHSQALYPIFTHIPGLKVVVPSNPYDAKGLLIASIEDDDPVVFFEPKRLYNGPFDGDANKPAVPWSTHPKGEVPDGYYTVPIGKAEVVRKGSAVTIVTYGTMVYVCEAAAKALGIDAEIIDVRSMVPLDTDTICSSVRRTGRCLIAHEATRFSGFGAELSATIQEECFWDLEAPIQRVAGWDTPYPHAFEWEYFPGPQRVAIGLKAVMEAA